MVIAIRKLQQQLHFNKSFVVILVFTEHLKVASTYVIGILIISAKLATAKLPP